MECFLNHLTLFLVSVDERDHRKHLEIEGAFKNRKKDDWEPSVYHIQGRRVRLFYCELSQVTPARGFLSV